jgi:hypothetical protein
LEGKDDLGLLQGAARSAQAGPGRTLVIAGEAGAGKSALLRPFAQGLTGARVHWGGSEALFTPRPLGPLRDIADGLDPHLAHLLEAGARQNVVFPDRPAPSAGRTPATDPDLRGHPLGRQRHP